MKFNPTTTYTLLGYPLDSKGNIVLGPSSKQLVVYARHRISTYPTSKVEEYILKYLLEQVTKIGWEHQIHHRRWHIIKESE